MKKILLTLFLALVTVCSWADEYAYINGLGYYINLESKEARVAEYNKCSGDLIIPWNVYYNGYTYPVTRICSYAFLGCKSLYSVTIPNTVTQIDNFAFNGCSSLSSVNIPESVTNIDDYVFSNCSSLPVINGLRYADTYLVEAVDKTLETYQIKEGTRFIGGESFAYCVNLREISIPSSVNMILGSAFEDCTSLESIEIPEAVKTIQGYAFKDCKSLKSITLPEKIEHIWHSTFRDCSSLATLTIPNSVSAIDEHAFDGCTSLVSVKMPTSLSELGRSAFANCSSLKNINIPEGVTKIEEGVFDNCTSLSSIEIPNTVLYLYNDAFSSCTSLTSLVLPDSLKRIGSKALYNCISLKSVVLPNSLKSIGHDAFLGCYSLSSVFIPQHVESIEYRVFGLCDSLKSIIVDERNPIYDSRNNCNAIIETANNKLIAGCYSTRIPQGIERIGSDAFFGCTQLITIDIPSSVIDIEQSAFQFCVALTSINIPEPVEHIGVSAFYECRSLESITLPKTIANIASWAFVGCESLKEVFCNAETVPETYSDAFYICNIEAATLYVPQASISVYKGKTPWSGFGSIKDISETIKCESPSISYRDGKLIFASSTDGAQIVSNITCEDVKTSFSNEIELTATYSISAYATKKGNRDSAVSKATLAWIAVGESSGIEDIQIPSVPVLFTYNNGILNVSADVKDEVPVAAYSLEGVLLKNTTTTSGKATLDLNGYNSKTIIVVVDGRSVKIQGQ